MFQQPTRPGWIEVISGVMFSGKSEELIRRVRRAVIARKQVQVFKSHLDARYAGLFSVSSHDGVTVEAEPVDSAEEIARRLRDTTEVVAVDEAQFLDDGIVDIANHLADKGVRVILAGTDVDFRGMPFGPMPTLMCIAEVVDKFQAICVVCGGPATRNQRLVNGKPALWDSPIIMVGGRESYEARCSHRHQRHSTAVRGLGSGTVRPGRPGRRSRIAPTYAPANLAGTLQRGGRSDDRRTDARGAQTTAEPVCHRE